MPAILRCSLGGLDQLGEVVSVSECIQVFDFHAEHGVAVFAVLVASVPGHHTIRNGFVDALRRIAAYFRRENLDRLLTKLIGVLNHARINAAAVDAQQRLIVFVKGDHFDVRVFAAHRFENRGRIVSP